jgi:Group II intron, maturase-specific domain
LELAEAKTRLVCLDNDGEGFDFLGFHHRMVESFGKPGFRYLARWPSAAAMQAARARIRGLTERRLLVLPLEDVVANLNRFLTGWLGLSSPGASKQDDEYRRRIRVRSPQLLARMSENGLYG